MGMTRPLFNHVGGPSSFCIGLGDSTVYILSFFFFNKEKKEQYTREFENLVLNRIRIVDLIIRREKEKLHNRM